MWPSLSALQVLQADVAWRWGPPSMAQMADNNRISVWTIPNIWSHLSSRDPRVRPPDSFIHERNIINAENATVYDVCFTTNTSASMLLLLLRIPLTGIVGWLAATFRTTQNYSRDMWMSILRGFVSVCLMRLIYIASSPPDHDAPPAFIPRIFALTQDEQLLNERALLASLSFDATPVSAWDTTARATAIQQFAEGTMFLVWPTDSAWIADMFAAEPLFDVENDNFRQTFQVSSNEWTTLMDTANATGRWS
jgi:hypothetical protein